MFLSHETYGNGGALLPFVPSPPQCPQGHGEKHPDCQCFFRIGHVTGHCMRKIFSDPIDEVSADS